MKHLRYLSILFIACGLMACQGQKTETVREIVNTNSQTSSPNAPVAEGGTHSGGDNGVQGRNMEDYAVDIRTQDIFKNIVLPIIMKVSETHPRFASDMLHIARERTWYLIPVSLNSLRASQIGVSFADEEIQQFALQNLKAIWINSTHYNKFDTDDSRGRLILHEILMGIRLMRLKNSLDNCYSSVALLEYTKEKEFKEARGECASNFMFKSVDPTYIPGVNKGLDLNADDYDNIRALVVNLWSHKGAVSKLELDAWMKTNNFRSYDK